MKKRSRFLCVWIVLFLLISSTSLAAADSTDGLLWLVGPDNPLNQNYAPSNTTNIAGNVPSTLSSMLMESRAAAACIKMVADMKADGVTDILATSGYRNYSKQSSLYANKVAQYTQMGYSRAQAKIQAAKIVAPPGQSEHQTGLAIDFTTNGIGGALDNRFANTTAGKWLIANAHKYGFILRYPADKTDITKITYEPWHYRYVGNPHATIMKEYGLCFEEYLEYLKSVDHFSYQLSDGSNHEIRYSDTNRSFGKSALVSTDNDGGYVITRYVPQDPLVSGRTNFFDYELRKLLVTNNLEAAALLPGRPLYMALKTAYTNGFPSGWRVEFITTAPKELESVARNLADTLTGQESRWFALVDQQD